MDRRSRRERRGLRRTNGPRVWAIELLTSTALRRNASRRWVLLANDRMTPRDSRRIDVRDDGHTRLANTNVGGLPAPRLSGGGGRDFQLSIGRPAIYCAMVQSNVHTITRSKMTDLLADRYRIDSPLGAG